MSNSKWIQMFWKNKDRVYVNKVSWDEPHGRRVQFKYSLSDGAKIYPGSRSNLTLNKSTKNPSTSNTKHTKKGKNPSIKYGKAGTRTRHQKDLVKEKYDELFASFGDNEIICFTDGACRRNPGPSGSGMVILYGKNGHTIEKSIALGNHTNNISELYAIGLSSHMIQHHPSSGDWIRNLRATTNGDEKLKIRILSDSKYSIGVLSTLKSKKNKQLIAWIKEELSTLCNDRFLVTFHWVGGHSGIEYNERADQLANQGVDGAKKGEYVDVTKPPDVYLNESKANVSVKRRKKRKLNELSDLTVINDGNRVKRRRLNKNLHEDTRSEDVDSNNSKHDGTAPQLQSPNIL
eukprot:955056_1